MEPLSTTELAGLKAWMTQEGLSQSSAARLLDMKQPSFFKWLNGGGVSPSGRAALLKLITPYLKPDHFVDADKMVPAEIRPSLRSIYAKLCELEERSPVAVKAAEMQLEALTLIWPPVVKDSLTVAPASKDSLTAPKSWRISPPPPPEAPELSTWRVIPKANSMMVYRRDIAAGPAREAQSDFIDAVIEGYERDHSLALMSLHGESMAPTFAHGCTLVYRSYTPPIVLGDDEDQHVPLTKIRAELRTGDAVIISFDRGETLTCKRVSLRGTNESWGLWLFADNPDEPGYPRLVKKKDHLTIYGRVLGLANVRQLDIKE